MSKFNVELMHEYADKLLIGLTLEEAETLVNEFDVIESRMDLINEIKGINEVEPMHFPFMVEPNIRDGKEIFNDNTEDLLKNSDKLSEHEIEVPKVVG